MLRESAVEERWMKKYIGSTGVGKKRKIGEKVHVERSLRVCTNI